MTFTHSQATQLLSSSEMELFNASQAAGLAKLSGAQLKANVHAARTARDKFQDLLRRQRLESRDRTGHKDGASGDDNARTEQKLQALTEVLHRFEAHMATNGSDAAATAGTTGTTKKSKTSNAKDAPETQKTPETPETPAPSLGGLMADVRSALEHKKELTAAHSASGTPAGNTHANDIAMQGSLHSGTSESARQARHQAHFQETGSAAVQGHTSTQIRRDQAKRDASHDADKS